MVPLPSRAPLLIGLTATLLVPHGMREGGKEGGLRFRAKKVAGYMDVQGDPTFW